MKPVYESCMEKSIQHVTNQAFTVGNSTILNSAHTNGKVKQS